MDTPHMPTMLDTLSALRVAYADLPAATIAAMLPQLDPETAARVQAMLTACDQCEAPRKAEIAQQQAASTAAVLATGAMAQGTSLQAIITAPRVTWDHRGMATSAAVHPGVLASRKVGEPSVQMRAVSRKDCTNHAWPDEGSEGHAHDDTYLARDVPAHQSRVDVGRVSGCPVQRLSIPGI